jgi:hypothetical protein
VAAVWVSAPKVYVTDVIDAYNDASISLSDS